MSADVRTIARGDASRILEARRAVARTDDEWQAMWLQHAGPDTSAPPVDFATRMVAAVFQGQRSAAGFDTSIVGARMEGEVLAVQVVEHLPLTPRVAAKVLVSPFHIVSMPRAAGDVRFVDALPHANADTQAAPAPATALRPTGLTAIPEAPKVRRVRPAPAVPPAARAAGSTSSSTGLSPEAAGALAYLAGPFSGALLLIVERTSRSVRFHAWQAFMGLGLLAVATVLCLGLAFFLLLFSPRGFSIMRWAAAGTAVTWVLLWGWCLWRAYHGQEWEMPVVGPRAKRLAAG